MKIYGIGGHTYPSMNVAHKQLHVSRRHMNQSLGGPILEPSQGALLVQIIFAIITLVIFSWIVIYALGWTGFIVVIAGLIVGVAQIQKEAKEEEAYQIQRRQALFGDNPMHIHTFRPDLSICTVCYASQEVTE